MSLPKLVSFPQLLMLSSLVVSLPPHATLNASCSWSCSCNHVPWCQCLIIRTLENGCGLWLGLLVSNCCCGDFSAIDIPWICVAWSEGVWKSRYWSSRFPIGMEALAERGFTEKSVYEVLLEIKDTGRRERDWPWSLQSLLEAQLLKWEVCALCYGIQGFDEELLWVG